MVIYAQVIHQTILYLKNLLFIYGKSATISKKLKNTKGGIAYKTFKY